MQRYDIGSSMAFWAGAHKSRMIKSSDGEYVLHSEAQAEIARLQAEVERLTRERDEAREGWHVEMPNTSSAPLK